MSDRGRLHGRASNTLRLIFWRAAASGWLSARWFSRDLPPPEARESRCGRLSIEIVSHCWNYAHLLVYQLSSLVNYPPRDVDVTMTVCHSPEDLRSCELLAYFGAIGVPGVRWNWQAMPRQQLFRRAIGRNRAALASAADWVWFTDCDLMFREGCLDTLAAQLQGRRDALIYPRVERRTELLSEDDPLLSQEAPVVVDIKDEGSFKSYAPGRATGPLQITHGDVARALGYCNPIAFYQQPAERWCKAYEDRAHRWLLQTQGTPVDIPGVYRIRHAAKGRYVSDTLITRLRTGLRKQQDARRSSGPGAH